MDTWNISQIVKKVKLSTCRIQIGINLLSNHSKVLTKEVSDGVRKQQANVHQRNTLKMDLEQ